MNDFEVIEVASTEIVDLLKDSALPILDIEDSRSIFVGIYTDNKLVGCVGIQIIDEIALLRSLAVSKEYRGQGLAIKLTKAIIQKAKSRSINSLFLLTTDAEKFFVKVGFEKIIKTSAPNGIKETKQYSEICSDSAVVMELKLN